MTTTITYGKVETNQEPLIRPDSQQQPLRRRQPTHTNQSQVQTQGANNQENQSSDLNDEQTDPLPDEIEQQQKRPRWSTYRKLPNQQKQQQHQEQQEDCLISASNTHMIKQEPMER